MGLNRLRAGRLRTAGHHPSDEDLSPGTPVRRPALQFPGDITAAADLVLATYDAGDGLGVGEVFFGENAGGEGVGVVGVEYRNCALEDDYAMVEVLVDEVHGAAGDLDAVIGGLLLGIEAGECG